jgi:hypothetical protein
MAVCLEYQSVYRSRKRSAHSLRFPLIAAFLLIIALSCRITLKLQATEFGYQLAYERKRALELNMQHRELLLERSILLRPDNLSKKAAKLGLIKVPVNHVLHFKEIADKNKR